MTAILFDSARPVNPAPHAFGRGILRSLPTYFVSHTAADEAWLLERDARALADAEPDYDLLAGSAWADDMMGAGLAIL